MIAKVVPAVRLPIKAGETYDYIIPNSLTSAVVPGSVVVIPFAGRSICGLVVSVSETTEHTKPLKAIIGVAQGLSPLPSYVVGLWTELSRLFATTLPRFVWAALPTIPSRAIVSANSPYPPLSQGRDMSQQVKISPPLFEKERSDVRSDHDLLIIDEIETSGVGRVPSFIFANSSLDALNIVKDIIAKAAGRQTLILVPTVDEAVAWSKTLDSAAVLHSALATGAKYNLAIAAANGSLKLVIGTKSAVFLPFNDLAQAVIINAGSNSHQQEDSDPRFDARIIAAELAKATGAELTAIDPLPPLGMMPLNEGDRTLHSSKENEGSCPLRWQCGNEPTKFEPLIHDLHDAAKAAKARVLLSDRLETAIDETLSAGGRVMVVLNRRGVSTAYVCRACGAMVNCPSCNIPLTIHHDRMSCSACERLYPLPDCCPKCNSLDLKPIGAGSKTLFDALKKRHPLAVIVHVDRDAWPTDLDAAQIVVGTTAIFGALPPVHEQFDLVADALMGAGQMRAGIWATENAARVLRTLASFMKTDGQLHIQTFDASAPALKALSDPTGFLKTELEERAAFGYPPVKTMITILGAGDAEEAVWKTANELVENLRAHLPQATCQEPAWSRPKLFRGKFRLSLSIKLVSGAMPHDLVQYLPVNFSAKVNLL